MIGWSIVVVSIIEAVGGVALTSSERLIIMVFFASSSTRTNSLICDDSTESMVGVVAK